MEVVQSVQKTTQYLLEAVARWFAPDDDSYPATGMQPFSGDPHHRTGWDD